MTLEVVSLPLGAYQTNCYVVRVEGSNDAVVIDPGDSAEQVLSILQERGLTLRGILVTHGHLDHIGAVHDLADRTGVEVWMARGGYVPFVYAFADASCSAVMPFSRSRASTSSARSIARSVVSVFV